MSNVLRAIVGLCLTIFAIAASSAQEQSNADPESSSSTVAYVYVQTAKGVNVYDASSAGKLTLVKGSPFATSGQMEGVTSSHLISVGTTNIRTYAVSSSGAVGKQQGVIDTQDYSGSECGSTSFNGQSNGALLDHTGKYFYVQMYGAIEGQPDYDDPICADWQTYQIDSNGELGFLGDAQYSSSDSSCGVNGWSGESTVPTISSNDKFAYGIFNVTECADDYGRFSSMEQNAQHVLQPNTNFAANGPSDNPNYPDWYYYPALIQADPSGHVAALLVNAYYDDQGCGGWPGCPVPIGQQLASYSINSSKGAIASANSYGIMPSVQLSANLLSMSNSGKLIAVGQAPGIQVFHFNGAKPITAFSSLIQPSVRFDQVSWDNSNHMYALSYSAGELYVFTVTPTTISTVAGSPFKIPTPYGSHGLIVVPK